MQEYNNFKSREEMLKTLMPSGLGIEIGVEAGNFSKIILETCPDLTLYMLDCWDYPIYGYHDRDVGSVEQQRDLMSQAIWNVRKNFKRTKIIKNYSEEFCRLMPDNYFDFIYIDADHSYAGLKKDIELWYPKLKSKGIFSGHDYLDRIDPECSFGVKMAVDNFCEINNLKLYKTISQEEEFKTWFTFKN